MQYRAAYVLSYYTKLVPCFINHFIFAMLAAAYLVTAPHHAAAQEGGYAVKTTARSPFVLKDGEVVQRESNQLIPSPTTSSWLTTSKLTIK
ncbi:hypothetical protein IC235_11795 [Hymenobacter sp. BT664]|uniref:Uncharacterized protein n=1 Tax=Hymenobacter montanus TaxID=2771359 RepID=A0A927BEF9_9BACT|nr:hypothetical protein [Hymenobacter montanus]MBD2768569.1 hypothetical protein [Hymenobacter montanus]